MPAAPDHTPAPARILRLISRVILLSFAVPVLVGLAGTSWLRLILYPLAFQIVEGSMPLVFVVISLGWLADWFTFRAL
jgi:hypothetical protein